jgi:DNA-binding transcriptional LysR family regulator
MIGDISGLYRSPGGTMMTDLNAMALFVKVVQTGSMSGAARLLGLPKSSVSRRIALLEAALNASLLHRSTRALSLTDTGKTYFDRVSPIVFEAEYAALEIQSRHARAVGLVRISATVGFGQKVLAPVICRLLRDEPDLRIELRLSDERLNVIKDGIDIAIRMGALDDAELLTRRMVSVERVVCAAPSYLETNGVPQVPADLLQHCCIVTMPKLNRWRFQDDTEIAVPWRFASGNILTAFDAAVGGHGIAMLPQFLVSDAVSDGRLVRLLADHPLRLADASVLYPRNRVPSFAAMYVIDKLTHAFDDILLR